eukprot:6109763-Pleurochrysis_carterae.AAC.1
MPDAKDTEPKDANVEDGYDDDNEFVDECEDEAPREEAECQAFSRFIKIWYTVEVFPTGLKGENNYSVPNCLAAREIWTC